MNTASTAFLSIALALACPHPLESAHVDIAQNSVRAGTSSVRAGSSLAPGSPVATGSNAKTQISLGGNGSLIRAGSKTEAVLQNETDLSLRQGVMLANSGRRTFGREPVSVETPETKSTVKGTMLVAYQPKVYIKVTCIEGEVTVKLKAVMGEFVTLQAGEMVIINPAEKQLPQEVEVDLDELTRTSSLMGSDFPELGSAPRVARAVGRQTKGIDQGDAVRTPLLLTGAGLEVTLSNERGVNARTHPPIPEPEPEPRFHRRRPPSSSSPGPYTPPYTPPDVDPPVEPTGPEYIIDGSTVFSPSDPSLQTPGFPLKAGQFDSSKPTTWQFPNSNPTRIPELLIRGNPRITPSSSSGDAYAADGTVMVGDSGNTQVFNGGPLTLGATDSVTVNSSSIVNENGPSSLHLNANRNVEIANSTIVQTSGITASAPSIRVDRSSLHSGNGGLQLTGTSQVSGISITNSSQLRSLAITAGVALQTQGGPIAIRNSQIDGSNVLIDTMLPSPATPDGLVEIENSTINADTIRARAFRSGGDRDALLISGSTFNAVNMIKFYAEGASRLRFQGNVNLNLNSSSIGRAILAGRTVQVDEGGVVMVNGNVEVYRDVDNYNKNGFGRIGATGQSSHQPFDSRPAF